MSLALINWASIVLSLATAFPETGGESRVSELKSAVGKLRQVAEKGRGNAEISYQFRVIEMDGLGWRSDWFEKLTPVTRQGSASVWTAPRGVARPIAAQAAKTIASPPRVTAAAQTAAHVSTRNTRNLVSRVSWNGEEPRSVTEAVREGMAATVVGRKIDQGILAHVVLEDTEIRKVHEVKLGSHEKDKGAAVSQPKTIGDLTAASHVLLVPEFDEQEIAGEWLIPKDGVLLISFGVHTEVGADGKAVVRERLMLVEAEEGKPVRATALRDREPAMAPLPSPSMQPTDVSPSPAPPAPSPLPSPGMTPVPPTPGGSPIPSPSIPSRTLPQGVNADGTPAELPPLPDDEAEPADDAGSAEPHGSPQTRRKDQTVPMPEAKPKPGSAPTAKTVDTQTSQAGYFAGPSSAAITYTLSIPASLNRWIEKVRTESLIANRPPSCHETDCCSEGDCEAE